jgi:predicted DsbA family dithiol-disulfide isomerase
MPEHGSGATRNTPRAPAVDLHVKVEIWSDVVCPWCAIGKRRFEKALAQFAHRDEVEVSFHSFELDSEAPREQEGDLADHLATKYGLTRERAEDMHRQMTETAAAEGWDFHFERARRGNTFDAHRVLHLAAERGMQDAVKERVLRGYFEEGAAVSDHATLVGLAAEAGLDADEVQAVLASDRYAEAVRADQRQAQAYGITAVPFFVVDRRYGVAGAQPPEALLQVLDTAWAQAHPSPSTASDAGSCADGSCSV